MDKASSVLAALEAGKLPSTQQINVFIDWLSDVGIARVDANLAKAAEEVDEAVSAAAASQNVDVNANTNINADALSAQGRVLASGLRGVLDAYKQLGINKNGDNVLQQALHHLTQGDLTSTPEAQQTKDDALNDISAIRRALRTLLTTLWSSLSSEGTSLGEDILSLIRLSLADAAELVEGQAGSAKAAIRSVEEEVREGKRDALGREKKRMEEEREGGAKVRWEHGMDVVKDTGSTVIGTVQSTTQAIEEKKEKTGSRLRETFYKVSDRAKNDPEYRQSLDTLFDIVQKRLNSTIDAASDPNTTLSSFVSDPTPEQHIPKALNLLRTLVERLANTSLEPLIQKFRTAAYTILQDPELKAWFDDFLSVSRKNLADPGYARSDEAEAKRQELRSRWKALLDKDSSGKWKMVVDDLKKELNNVQSGMENDEDLNRLKEAHAKLGADIERGLVDASEEAKTGVQAAIEQATWFWQDLFKYYIPKFLSKMKDVPIPRTEYKDDEIEFVLENLDISTFNILPSHVYIRNITDIDIQTSAKPSTPSHTNVGALTHVRIQALQLSLKDVSFWYKDKTASAIGPSEFTGLLGLKLPEKGIDVDLKIRLIPANATGSHSRAARKHFNVIESASVSIAEDVGIDIRDSNHSVLVTVFKPMMVAKMRQALEKTLTEQIRAIVDWADGVAFDVGRRREVFEDTGLGGGGSLMAAVWSEIGRLERESREGPVEMGWHATGTGLVVEQSVRVEGTGDEFGEGQEVRRSMLAMGAEPQILDGAKRGPVGSGSERIVDKLERRAEEMDVDVPEVDVRGVKRQAGQLAKDVQERAQGLYKEGERQVKGFRRSVERKKQVELNRQGWQSSSFDV
ncbi:hypothetical protein JR316_0012357 [Psilocybe cubensis]|uniref:Uncharacterized protein n=2 Tax=Psilocybe cubensis TaxID=181762 RepID=A0ACB8GIA6_PSICU|nr:hypothetical protein JR316_0012357 [Psilocybe cubensis]KAH9475246.1 hypothetical protein JR316_0012357 [Psilocybe cubensis]